MKKVILLLVLLTFSFIAYSQSLRGGFGHGYIGVGFNISPDIQSDLESPSLLGDNLQLYRLTKFAGGGGYGLIGKRFLIGGSGFGYEVSDATLRGQAKLDVGGGFFNAGYLMIAKDNILGFPYVGIGGHGMRLKLQNDMTDQSINVGNKIIYPGDNLKMNAAGINLDVGFSMQFLTFQVKESGNSGGFMVGIQAGTYFFAGLTDWKEQSTNDIITPFSQPYALSPYIRLTIGGGGFTGFDD